MELTAQVVNPAESNVYPSRLDTDAKRALYDNLDKKEDLALAIDTAIRAVKKDNWRGNKFKEREVRIAITEHLPEEKVDEILELVKNQRGY
jgi:type I restriction enzyme R subunit